MLAISCCQQPKAGCVLGRAQTGNGSAPLCVLSARKDAAHAAGLGLHSVRHTPRKGTGGMRVQTCSSCLSGSSSDHLQKQMPLCSWNIWGRTRAHSACFCTCAHARCAGRGAPTLMLYMRLHAAGPRGWSLSPRSQMVSPWIILWQDPGAYLPVLPCAVAGPWSVSASAALCWLPRLG